MADRGGQPGNDNATKSKQWRSALDRAIAQDDGKRLRAAAEKLLDLAEAGEGWAVKELGDRLDGKAAQQLIHTGDADAPVIQKITVEVVDATVRE